MDCMIVIYVIRNTLVIKAYGITTKNFITLMLYHVVVYVIIYVVLNNSSVVLDNSSDIIDNSSDIIDNNSAVII